LNSHIKKGLAIFFRPDPEYWRNYLTTSSRVTP
jgi:hypothetical protein